MTSTAPVPTGYAAQVFSPEQASSCARQLVRERGHLDLDALERRLVERLSNVPVQPMRLSTSKHRRHGGCPSEAGGARPALFAHVMDVWNRAVDADSVDDDAYRALRQALLSQAPQLLFASAYHNTVYEPPIPEGEHNRVTSPEWLSPGEVLLACAALLEQRPGAGGEVGPLLRAVDRARPQWRQEHTANWAGERRRAALLWYQRVSRLNGVAWDAVFRVLAGTLTQIGAPNAAQLVCQAMWQTPDLATPLWADIVSKIRQSGINEGDYAVDIGGGNKADNSHWPYRRLGAHIEWRLSLGHGAATDTAHYWRHQLLGAQLAEPEPTTPTLMPGPTL